MSDLERAVGELNASFNPALNASSWQECRKHILESIAPAARELVGELTALRRRLTYAEAEISVLRTLQTEKDKQIEELRKDAQRLDYLQANARSDPKMDGNHVWWPTTVRCSLKGPTLRAAIDAALGSQDRQKA